MTQEKEPLRIEIFGGCPFCGRHEEGLYVGCDHWTFCRRHRVRWLSLQTGLPSPETDKQQWVRNAEFLAIYEIVEPVFPRPFHFPGIRWLFRLADAVSRRRWSRPYGGEKGLPWWPFPPMPVLLPHSVKWDLWHVLDHFMEDEAEDYFGVEGDERHPHIYEPLRRIRNWLVTDVGR